MLSPYEPAITYATNLRESRTLLANQIELVNGDRCVKAGALLAAQNEVKHWESLLRQCEPDTATLACLQVGTAVLASEEDCKAVSTPDYVSVFPVLSCGLDEVWTEYGQDGYNVNAQWIVKTECGEETINVLIPAVSAYHADSLARRFRAFFPCTFVNGVKVRCQDGAIVNVSI